MTKQIKHWTARELKQLTELYREHPIKECARRLNVTIEQARSATRNHGIKSGRTGHIQKGNIPHNKGKHYPTSAKCLQTCFKPGHLPPNTKHNGAITIRRDKGGNYYQHIRIGLSQWEFLHVHNYKTFVGEIKPGNIVVFKNSNTLDCSPENLEQITRAEHMRRNQNHTKGGQSLRKMYQRERIRKKYGLSALTKHGDRIVNY